MKIANDHFGDNGATGNIKLLNGDNGDRMHHLLAIQWRQWWEFLLSFKKIPNSWHSTSTSITNLG